MPWPITRPRASKGENERLIDQFSLNSIISISSQTTGTLCPSNQPPSRLDDKVAHFKELQECKHFAAEAAKKV